jgi:hypothetical protein
MGLANRLSQINNGQTSATKPLPSAPPQPPQPVIQQQQPPIQQQNSYSYAYPPPQTPQPHTYPSPTNYPQQSAPVPIPQSPTKTQTPINKLRNTFNGMFTKQTPFNKGPIPTTPGPFFDAVKTRIDKTIFDKKLQYFSNTYPQKYNDTLMRASHIDFVGLAQKRGFSSVELALDLASLAPYDVIIHIDDSGSMLYDEFWKPCKGKIDDVSLILDRIVDIAKEFDDDGISIRTFKGTKNFDDITTTEEAKNAISNLKYSGGTPLGSSLKNKILKPFVYDQPLQKPVVIYIITDGQPDNKEEVRQVIQECKNFVSQRYSEHAVSFMFAQVGKDPTAAAYLTELDVDPYIKEDVDTIGCYETECEKYAKNNIDLTPDLWMLQMMVGSVNSDYDEGND